MSLIPFILDLADELNEINRNMVSSMDVDDFGFGVYPHEVHQASPRWPRAVSQFYLLPSTRGRHHPYWRSVGSSGGGGGGGSRSCCHRALVDKESAAVNDRESAAKPAAAAFAVINRNGFQVSMNVKQFSPNDLTVKTIDNCIVVEGQHDEKEDGHGVISRHFVRKYVLPKGFDPNEVLSTLSSDGILTVKAPPPTKAEEKLERLVHIQQTGPAQLSAKDAACGGATNKDKLQTLQTTATTTTQTSPAIQQPGAELEQQQQQEKSQKQQQQQQQQEQEQSKQQGQQQNEEKKMNVINEHNGDANANEINSGQGSTAATDTSSTSSMEPVVLVSNMVDPAAINAIIVTASAATATAATANAAAGESDTKPSVADIPMVDVAVPDGVIESIVLVAASAAGIDGVGAVGIGGNEPAESVVNSVVTPTVGDLVAAADAAILLAKTQCENGNKTATGEEVAN